MVHYREYKRTSSYGGEEQESIMGSFQSFFLRAKHVQIFLLFVVVCYVGPIITWLFIAGRTSQGLQASDLLLLGLVTAIQVFGFLSWFLCVGLFLCTILRPALKPKVGFFEVAVVFPILYSFAVPTLFLNDSQLISDILIPLHLFAMVCAFYCFSFVAKCLARVETGKAQPFSKYAGTFLLLWFFPLGVWIIQPKINRLYREQLGS